MRRFLSILCVLSVLLSMICLPTFAAAANGEQSFGSLQEALNDYTDGVIVLAADAENITVTRDVYLDLNGHAVKGVTVTDGTLYCMDSQTDDFTVTDGKGYGTVSGVLGKVAPVANGTGYAEHGYLMVDREGTLSFHCVNLNIFAMTLRPSEAGVYFRSCFAADEVAAEEIESFGVALSLAGVPTEETMGTRGGYTAFTGFVPGPQGNQSAANGTILTGVMKESNTDDINDRNANMDVYGAAYIRTESGVLFGKAVQRDLLTQVKGIDDNWSKLNATQKSSINAMYNTFSGVMSRWGLVNIGKGPAGGDDSITLPISVVTEDGVVSQETVVTAEDISVTVPAGVQLAPGATELKLVVTQKKTSDSGLEVDRDQALMPVDVHMEGVSPDNTIPFQVCLGKVMPENLNMGNYRIFHVEDGKANQMELVAADEAFTAHNQFRYSLEGDLTLNMATFSEVAVVTQNDNIWNGKVAVGFSGGDGTEENPYIIRNADQLAYLNKLISANDKDYNTKHYKLVADIDFGGEGNPNVWYPIGYWYPGTGTNSAGETEWYQYGGAFQGVFDGNGNTISNIYQNTWALDGAYDYGYWNAAMGLFGYVYGGTVKNLTIDRFSSDGEFTPTGCVAAYAAKATFENIAITNSNPRVYNTGNGGVVGIAGSTSEAGKITMKNVTVDQSNTISALWGTYDCAAGGLIGMLRGSTETLLENCHVAAKMDVYNDVCGNYQYYWYRYCGMLIGSVRKNTTDSAGYTVADTSQITATNCSVAYGEWNEYWYCELVENTVASYTHDHQFSRLTKIENKREIFDGENWIQTGNFVIPGADNESAQCFHIRKDADGNLYQHNHEDAGFETKDVNGDGIVDSDLLKEDRQCYYLPFAQLITGDGWGVKAHLAFDGVELVTEGPVMAEQKFESIYEGEAIETGSTVSFAELFRVKEGAKLSESTVYMFVSPVGENSTVKPAYVCVSNGYLNDMGALTLEGTGAAKITVTDYFYCKETTIYVTVSEPTAVDKFLANSGKSFTAGQTIKLGDIFTAADDVEIDAANVVVSVTGAEAIITPDKDAWENSTIVINDEAEEIAVTITDNDYCVPGVAYFAVKENDYFTTVLENANKYLYRVGNENSFALGKLFGANEGFEIYSDVTITAKSIINNEVLLNSSAPKGAWTTQTISFDTHFTGPVVVTLDALGAKPYELKLEVVEAINSTSTTSVTSATSNNVVLLNDASGTFSVSDNHTFYGNGFTVTLNPASHISSYSSGFVGYINIFNGNLDNVQIDGPVYPEVYIYRGQAGTEGGDCSYFKNAVIINEGNCKITNSYISGGRAAIYVKDAHAVTIENTTVSGGAYANIQVSDKTSATLILKDVTTIQKETENDYGVSDNNVSRKMIGMGIVISSSTSDVYLEGTLTQYNWVNKAQWDAMIPDAYASQFPDFFGDTVYQEFWHYRESDAAQATPYINLTLIFACEWDESKLHDNRTERPLTYISKDIEIASMPGGVYSVTGAGTLTDVLYVAPDYAPDTNGYFEPSWSFDLGDQVISYDGEADDRYLYGDKTKVFALYTSGKDPITLDLTKLSTITKYTGTSYTVTASCKDEKGTVLATDSVVTLSDAGTYTLVFTIRDNWFYGADGNKLEGVEDQVYTYETPLALSVKKAAWKNAEITLTTSITGSHVSDGGTFGYDPDYYYRMDFSKAISIRDYDENGKASTVSLTENNPKLTISGGHSGGTITVEYSTGNILTVKLGTFPLGIGSSDCTVGVDANGLYVQTSGKSNNKENTTWTITSVSYEGNNGTPVTKTETITATFTASSSSGGGCVSADTMISLADGTQKRIDEVTYDDQLLVWNYFEGKYDVAPASIIFYHGHDAFEILNLFFDDGTTLKVINDHGLFDVEENNYIYIDATNVENYIGHSFVKANGKGYTSVVLTGYEITEEYTGSYCLQTSQYNNYIAEGLFSLTKPEYEGWFDYFEIGNDMKYDEEKMRADIEKYGLYTYEDFAEYVTYEQFVAFSGPYLKVLVGKGILTYEQILELIESYVAPLG